MARARNDAGELLESAFQTQVIQLARFYGWRVAHFRAAPAAGGKGRRERWATAVAADGAGFPDLVLVRGPELLFVELKRDTGRLRSDQVEWLDDLSAVEGAVIAAVAAIEGMAPGLAPNVQRPAVEAHVWRPRDFDDVVHPRLARGRRRQEPVGA